MSLTDRDRDSGLHHYEDTRAGVRDYVDCVIGGMAVEVLQDGGGTVYATSGRESDVYAVAEGPGGGFTWERDWSRQEYHRYLTIQAKHNPQIRRGPRSEVFPEGYL